MYDLLIKECEVVDPAQGIHCTMDIAIKDGKIAALEKDIAQPDAREVIILKGRIAMPGLIDMHCHCAEGIVSFGVHADDIGLDSGVTLLCDGGSTGPANFYTMRKCVLDPSQTNTFCFLNLAATGLVNMPEIRNEHDWNLEQSRTIIAENRDLIKGVKVRAVRALAEGVGLTAIESAKKLAYNAKLPLVLHIGDGKDRVENECMDDFSREAVKLLEKGDILTHIMTWSAGGLILRDGTIYPEVWQARDRGVIFDACLGFSNFSIETAKLALGQGFLPTVISTDLTVRANLVVQSLAVAMSLFLNLGLSIDQVVEMTTINPAKALGEQANRGSLKLGLPANISVLELVQGDYLFSDGNGRSSIQGNLLLEPRLVINNGVPLPCRSRYHIPPVYQTIQ